MLAAHALAVELARRVGHRPRVGDVRQQIHLVAAGIQHRGRVFATALAPAQMVQAQVGHNPVQPGIKRALEPEVSQMPVRLQERLLVHVLGVLLVAQHMQRQPQDGLVVAPHQRIERARSPCWASRIRSSSSVRCWARASNCAWVSLLPFLSVFGPGLRRRLWHRWGRFYRPRSACAHRGRRVQQVRTCARPGRRCPRSFFGRCRQSPKAPAPARRRFPASKHLHSSFPTPESGNGSCSDRPRSREKVSREVLSCQFSVVRKNGKSLPPNWPYGSAGCYSNCQLINLTTDN